MYSKEANLRAAYKISGVRAVFGEAYPDPVCVVVPPSFSRATLKVIQEGVASTATELSSLKEHIDTIKLMWKTWEEELRNIVKEQGFLSHQDELEAADDRGAEEAERVRQKRNDLALKPCSIRRQVGRVRLLWLRLLQRPLPLSVRSARKINHAHAVSLHRHETTSSLLAPHIDTNDTSSKMPPKTSSYQTYLAPKVA